MGWGRLTLEWGRVQVQVQARERELVLEAVALVLRSSVVLS